MLYKQNKETVTNVNTPPAKLNHSFLYAIIEIFVVIKALSIKKVNNITTFLTTNKTNETIKK